MRKSICFLFIGLVVVVGTLVFFKGPAQAITGGATGMSCPDGFREQYFVNLANICSPYTISIYCTNTDLKATRTFVTIYYNMYNDHLANSGALELSPGESTWVNYPASEYGKAIICANKPKFACDAVIKCSTSTAIVPLKVFKKKQKGD